jgi:putative peptidoglycan lipid II flippase
VSTALTSALLSLLTLTGSILGMVTQVILARKFGTGHEIEAFFVAQSGALWATGIILGFASYHLVPVLTKHRATANSHDEYANALIVCAIPAGLAIAIIGTLASLLILPRYANYPLVYPHRLTAMVSVAWTGTAIAMYSSVLTAIAQSRHEFYRAAFLNCIPPSGAIVVLILLPPTVKSALIVSIAMVAGQAVGACILSSRMRVLTAIRLPTRAALSNICRDISHTPTIIASMLGFTSFATIDAYLGGLISDGAVATMAFAQRLIVALGSLSVNGIAVVMTPHFSERHARSQVAELHTDVYLAIRSVVILTAVPAAILAVLALPTITMLFQGGRFSIEHASNLATTLRLMLPGLVMMCACTVLFRALYAAGDPVSAAIASIAVVSSYLVLGAAFIRFEKSTAALAYAYDLAWLFGVGVAFIRVFSPRIAGHVVLSCAAWSVRFCAVLAVAGIVAYLIGSRIQVASNFALISEQTARLGIAYLFSIAAATGAGLLFRVPEFLELRSKATHSLRRCFS